MMGIGRGVTARLSMALAASIARFIASMSSTQMPKWYSPTKFFAALVAGLFLGFAGVESCSSRIREPSCNPRLRDTLEAECLLVERRRLFHVGYRDRDMPELTIHHVLPPSSRIGQMEGPTIRCGLSRYASAAYFVW
jgi:hypothetical protein